MKKPEEIDLSNFKRIFPIDVRFSDLDLFSIVHNIRYFYWIEWAREEYIRDILDNVGLRQGFEDFIVMVAHSEIDYYRIAMSGEKLSVLTRVKSIGDSSMVFENVILNEKGEILVYCSSVVVHVNFHNKLPQRIPDNIRNAIDAFEKIIDN
jgi:YbgC/YbaW family acyl-CoA thioester hydrolase